MSDPMKVQFRVQAPAGDVRHALTAPDALRTWLAEYAEVSPPDRYAFWGRYTPAGDEPRQRLLRLDDRTLRFSWPVDGTDTTVTFELEESGDVTLVTFTHEGLPGFADMVAGVGTLSLLYTFWALSIANLVDHVEGRPLTAKCDFTSTDLREQVTINAPRRRVFESLADPKEFSRWFGAHIEADPRVGGRFAMGPIPADQPAAKIVELEPGGKMSIAWSEDMVTTWELEDAGGGTRLTFVQSGFGDGSYGAWMGNLAGLAELRRYHELPDWRPIRLSVHLDGMPDGMIELG